VRAEDFTFRASGELTASMGPSAPRVQQSPPLTQGRTRDTPSPPDQARAAPSRRRAGSAARWVLPGAAFVVGVMAMWLASSLERPAFLRGRPLPPLPSTILMRPAPAAVAPQARAATDPSADPAQELVRRVTIELRTDVPRVSVTLDGAAAGHTPLVLRVPRGQHTLGLSHTGYARVTKIVDATMDRTIHVALPRRAPR
jgi:hypothetical protein